MKNIKIRTSWTKANRNEDGSLTESCKKYIYMDIDITGATEDKAELILNKLVDNINKEGCYCDRAGCIGIEENKKGELIYYDMLFFNREIGNVTQQKRGLMVLINSIKKEVIKEVLKEEEPEQEEPELDKNKKQILKQWKALAESNLNSKELKEQAKEFYNLFKSVLVENKTQLNGNEYKNIISSLRAYGYTKPAKDKDIIVIELLNLNKSSIVLEPGSIEPLNMFLGNVLGWFKRYYAITEEQEKQEQEEENTSMKNIKIKKTDRGYYTVVADTQKFGTNEILFEGRNIEECKNYIKRTLILILKVQLQNNKAQEAENTIKTLISYLNDEKQKTINNNIAKSWELFSTGAINMEISETEKGYYFVGEQAPVKFTFFIDKEGKDTRKQKNDKVVNTLTDDFVVEF